jgi:FtsZ-binding cell division protein ZapB
MGLNNSNNAEHRGVKSLNAELQKAINQVGILAKLIEGLSERLNTFDKIVETQKTKQEELNDLQISFQEELQKLLADLKIAEERIDLLES